MTTTSDTTVRINTAVNDIWPAVKGEIRGNGKPVFRNLDSLGSHVTRAFHKGLITGEQHREGSTIWVNRDDALDYLAQYIELAKASPNAKIHLPSKKKGTLVKSAGDIAKYRQAGTPVQETGHQYSVVMGGEIIPLLDEGRPATCLTDKCAALMALKQLQVGLYRETNGKLVRVV